MSGRRRIVYGPDYHSYLHHLVMRGGVIIRPHRPYGPYELIYWPDPLLLDHHHEVADHLHQALEKMGKWVSLFSSRPAWYDDTYTCRKAECRRL